jgi:uncharacterized protein YjbI with pentapeptide repeats
LITVLLGLVAIPGCLAVGTFSPKALNKGQDILVVGQNFTEDIDLTDILEFKPTVPGVMKAVVEGHVVFEKCKFYKFSANTIKDGKTYMVEFKGDLVFDHCSFRDTVNLQYITVDGDFYAGSSEFMEIVKFDYSWFKGRNNIFSNALFFSSAWFNNVIFENRSHFFKTQFKDAVMFQSAVFRGHSFFGAAGFDGYAEFGNSRFLQDLNMTEAAFSDRTNFGRMHVLMQSVFSNARFSKKADFLKSEFYLEPDFRGAKFISGRASDEEEQFDN